MPALFSPRATPVARGVLLAGFLAATVAPTLAMVWVRTPAARGEHVRIAQPVPFEHRLHAGPLRIDCRYCHTGVERSAFAGLPSTQQCVACHVPALMGSPVMAPVRASVATGRPIAWNRVTQLPDFVYFNHAIHVN